MLMTSMDMNSTVSKKKCVSPKRLHARADKQSIEQFSQFSSKEKFRAGNLGIHFRHATSPAPDNPGDVFFTWSLNLISKQFSPSRCRHQRTL